MLGTITTTEPLYDPVRSMVAELGYCVSPDDAFLALRGLRTLGLRLERHHQSAMKVAEWLVGRPEVKRVLYPALPSDLGHAIWKRDFTGASGLFGVVLHPVSKAAVDAMLNSLKLFGMSIGTTCGLTLRGPLVCSTSFCASRVRAPPMPEPITTARRSGSTPG